LCGLVDEVDIEASFCSGEKNESNEARF
jgi:hypothetical protein